jgi:hypothetical protein
MLLMAALPALAASSPAGADEPGFFRGAFDLASQSFATSEQVLRSRLGFSWSSARFTTDFRGFHEAGPAGDWSVDFPQLYGRAADPTEFWLGRRLPWASSRDGVELMPAWSSARSQAWVQNQSDVFDPRAVGWVGAGVLHPLGDGTTLSVAYSPLFLPHFGPSVRLSQDLAAEASRYGRLPPQQVRIGEAVFPIRYRIDTGDLRSILLQQQAYAELKRGEFSLVGWSAPNPEPEVDPRAELLLRDESSRVLVTARPRFIRQDFAGLLWNSSHARAEALYELRSRTPLVSLSVMPIAGFQAGVLHRWSLAAPKLVIAEAGQPAGAAADSSDSDSVASRSKLSDPARGAAFVRWNRPEGRVRPWVEWRGHFAAIADGLELLDGSLRTGLEAELFQQKLKAASPSLGLFASAQVLGARDESPWASWRSLDYVQVGMVSRW